MNHPNQYEPYSHPQFEENNAKRKIDQRQMYSPSNYRQTNERNFDYRQERYSPANYYDLKHETPTYPDYYESGPFMDQVYSPYYEQDYLPSVNEDTPFDYFQKPVQPTYYERPPYPEQQQQAPQPPNGDNRFLAHFQDDKGQYDFDKIFSTAGQFIGIVRQVSPMFGQLSTFIKTMRQ